MRALPVLLGAALLAPAAGCRGCGTAACEPEVACDGVDQDCDGADDCPDYPVRADAELRGALADEGYGAALAWYRGELWVGAPFDPGGGRLYREDALVRTGAPFLGTALVATDEGVRVGADGRVEDTAGAVLLERAGVGGVLAAEGARWISRAPSGVVRDDGSSVELGARPDSLLLVDGEPAAGFAFGDTVLRAGSLTATRNEGAHDEAGWALARADVDADGVAEWIVAAPADNRVDVLDPVTLALERSWSPGPGRFGAALATDGRRVFVGAPMAGDDAAGAVWTCSADGCAQTETGAAPQDQLGFALVYANGNLYVGAPGGPGTAGSVRVRTP